MDWGIRRQSIVGLGSIGVLVAFVGVWGSMASLSGAVAASGQIEPEGYSQVVQHLDGGTVAEIRVRDGDSVRQGDILIVLDGSALRSALAIVNGQLVGLIADAARLVAEQSGKNAITLPDDLALLAQSDGPAAAVVARENSLFLARLNTYQETVNGLREQQTQKRGEIDGRNAQVISLQDQYGLIDAELGDARRLQTKGLILSSRVWELERLARALEGQIAETEASVASARSEIARLDVEILRLAAAREEEATTLLRDTEDKIRELREHKRDYQSRVDRLSMKAPRSGTVHNLQVHSLGAVIRPADPVLFVVPQDDPLTITAKVDANHIDSVFPGQPAVLRFTSFDVRITPELNAKVLRVSADTITDNRTGQQYYTAELEIVPGELPKLDGKALLPGMPVEVYIQTGSRSPLQYALKPFLDFVRRGFRE